MTECKQNPLQFHPHGRREVVAEFDGGRITSELPLAAGTCKSNDAGCFFNSLVLTSSRGDFA
jgi:hypothetical protein